MSKSFEKIQRQGHRFEEEKERDSTANYRASVDALTSQLTTAEKIERINGNQEKISSIHPATWACFHDEHIQELLIKIQGYNSQYAREMPTRKVITLLDGALHRLVLKLTEYQNSFRCSECKSEISDSLIKMENCVHSFHRCCFNTEEEYCCQACRIKCVICEQEINILIKPASLVLTNCFHIFHDSCLALYKARIDMERLRSLMIIEEVEEVYSCPECSNYFGEFRWVQQRN